MDQTVNFEKSYEDREQEFMNILSKNVTKKEIFNEWVQYLYDIVDPLGWQAIWKIPQKECEMLNISYPTLALVFIDKVILENLKAKIKLVSAQNGLEFSDLLYTDLSNLWPTKNQDEKTVFNLNPMSDALDSLRFFYKYLWRPWDANEPDDHWLPNLKPRLRLYYDLKCKNSKTNRDYFRSLLKECKEIHIELIKLQETNPEDDDKPELIETFIRLTESRQTLELFENPCLRNEVLIKNDKNAKSTFWIVVPTNFNINDYYELFKNVKSFCPSDCKFNIATTLQEALDSTNSNSVIYIGHGEHVVHSSKNLVYGGKIINVNSPKEAVITTKNKYQLFDFKKGEVYFQNLVFQLNKTVTGLKLKGVQAVHLNNCIFKGYSENNKDAFSLMTTQQAIWVEESSVYLNECSFFELGTAVTLDCGSLSMQKCNISDVRFGIRMKCHAKLTLIDCNVFKYLQCVLNIESNRLTETEEVEELDNFPESYSNIEIGDIKIEDGLGPKVIIRPKIHLNPIKDIFMNPFYNTYLLT